MSWVSTYLYSGVRSPQKDGGVPSISSLSWPSCLKRSSMSFDQSGGVEPFRNGTRLCPSTGVLGVTPARSAKVGAMSTFMTESVMVCGVPLGSAIRSGVRMHSSYAQSFPRQRCSPKE